MLENDEQRKIDRILKLTEENNSLLHKLHRSMIYRRMISIFYWILVIAITFGTYYYIQGFLESLGPVGDLVPQPVQNLIENLGR